MARGEKAAPVESAQLEQSAIDAEAARGRIVALFALVAVLVTSASLMFGQSTWSDLGDVKNWADRLDFFLANKTSVLASAILFSLGTALTIPVLLHVATAIRERRPSMPKVVVYLSIAGPVLLALAIPAIALIYMGLADDFGASSIQTAKFAKDLTDDGALTAGIIALQAGAIAAGFAWVMIGSYGIRTGLLTRVLGAFSVIVGILTVFVTTTWFATNSMPSPIEIVRVFVIGAIAVMLVGSAEKRPPAWREGHPVPWPKLGAPRDGDEPSA